MWINIYPSLAILDYETKYANLITLLIEQALIKSLSLNQKLYEHQFIANNVIVAEDPILSVKLMCPQ